MPSAPDQDLDHPLGVGGEGLHEWAFATRTFRQMLGIEGGSKGLDDEFAARGDVGIGATIMGRNMFGPIRGVWGDEDWNGWWGDNPPYHHPVCGGAARPNAQCPSDSRPRPSRRIQTWTGLVILRTTGAQRRASAGGPGGAPRGPMPARVSGGAAAWQVEAATTEVEHGQGDECGWSVSHQRLGQTSRRV